VLFPSEALAVGREAFGKRLAGDAPFRQQIHQALLQKMDQVGFHDFRYARIAAGQLLTYRAQTYRIAWPNGSRSCKALLVTLANAPEFGNGARIAPGARVDDGWLDLVVVEARSRLGVVCAVPRLFTGGIERVRGVSIRRVDRVTLESDRPMTFHVDGEPVQGGTRLDACLHRSALRVSVR